MTPSKQARLESGLNAYATKVLHAVPIAEAWSQAAIENELRRTGGNPDRRVVSGSLRTLIDSGLVTEQPAGMYRRRVSSHEVDAPEPAPARATLKVAPKEAPAVAAELAATSDDTLSKLATIAADMRTSAKLLEACAAQIEEVALQVEERIADAGTAAAQLRQLKAILGGV